MEEDTSEVAAPRNTTKPVATSKWDGVLEAISANTPTTCPRRRRTRPAAARTEAEEGTTRRTETDTGRPTPTATPTAEVGRIDDERRVRRRITLAVVVVVVEKFIYNFTIVFVALRSKKAI